MGLAGAGEGGEPLGRGGREQSWGVAVCLLCHTRSGALPCPSLRSHGGVEKVGAEVRGLEGPSLNGGMGSDCLLRSAEARVRGQRLVKSRTGRSAAEA